jgi:HEPN domain-containing protein
MKLFSYRYRNVIFSGKLKVPLNPRLRVRIRKLIAKFNETWRETDETNWNYETSTIDQMVKELLIKYGMDSLQVKDIKTSEVRNVEFSEFVEQTYPAQVLDVIELFANSLSLDLRRTFQDEMNECFEEEESDLRILQGEIFKIDEELLKQRSLSSAMSIAEKGGFSGALEELREALKDYTTQDHKGAIHNAAKAVESVIKKILNKESGTYQPLVKELFGTGFYENIPDECRSPFQEVVFAPLAAMRNRMGGHGQGGNAVEIPRQYAELAVNLASAYVKFLIEQQLGSLPEGADSQDCVTANEFKDDDLPF